MRRRDVEEYQGTEVYIGSAMPGASLTNTSQLVVASLVTFTRVTSGQMQFIFARGPKKKAGRTVPRSTLHHPLPPLCTPSRHSLRPTPRDLHLANYLLSRPRYYGYRISNSRTWCSISPGIIASAVIKCTKQRVRERLSCFHVEYLIECQVDRLIGFFFFAFSRERRLDRYRNSC